MARNFTAVPPSEGNTSKYNEPVEGRRPVRDRTPLRVNPDKSAMLSTSSKSGIESMTEPPDPIRRTSKVTKPSSEAETSALADQVPLPNVTGRVTPSSSAWIVVTAVTPP